MGILLNEAEVVFFTFPAGEIQVRINPSSVGSKNTIRASLWNASDIMVLFHTVDAVRRVNPLARVALEIPYFPYARQDRVCQSGESLGVRVMADMINSLRCDQVTLWDPHSDVTGALIERVRIETQASIVKNHLASSIIEGQWNLVAPDAGAEKKVRYCAQELKPLGASGNILFGSKTRDLASGKILHTAIHGEVNNNPSLVLDDICDGGSTFIRLAEELKKKTRGPLHLYVTHGIFSHGVQELKRFYDKIFCYHSPLSSVELENQGVCVLSQRANSKLQSEEAIL